MTTEKKLDQIENIEFIFDAISAYKITISKNSEGLLSTSPINGAIFMFNTKTGNIVLDILHKSIWNTCAHPRTNHQELSARRFLQFLYSLPNEPKEIAFTQLGMKTFFQDFLQISPDLPKISLEKTPVLNPHFAGFLKLNRILNHVSQATEDKKIVYNLYDDWLKKISFQKAFFRLNLIFYALQFWTKESISLLKLEPENPIFWPIKDEDEWIIVEMELEKLIKDKLNFRFPFDPTKQTTSIEDILWGD